MHSDIISENCDDEVYNCRNLDGPCDIPSKLSKLKTKNVKRLITRHLTINSLPNKFDRLKMIIGNNNDILIVTETLNL